MRGWGRVFSPLEINKNAHATRATSDGETGAPLRIYRVGSQSRPSSGRCDLLDDLSLLVWESRARFRFGRALATRQMSKMTTAILGPWPCRLLGAWRARSLIAAWTGADSVSQ